MAVNQTMVGKLSAMRKKNYNDPVANTDRLAAMRWWRGGVIQGLERAEWSLSSYSEADFPSLHLINSSDWREIGSGSLDPLDIARRIESDSTLRCGKYAAQINYILTRLASLATTPSRIIFVGVKKGPYVIIDGVHRAIAACLYYRVGERKDFPTKEAYAGILESPYIRQFG